MKWGKRLLPRLERKGYAEDKQLHERFLALRYKGQSFELEIAHTEADIATSFHRAHRQRYGYAQEAGVIEIVSVRLRSSGLVERIPQQRELRTHKSFAKASRFVEAYFAGKKLRTAVYERKHLSPGEQLSAPCIVTEYSATTLIPPGATAELDEHRNLSLK